MNADQLNGKWTQFKGNLKQQWGKFINDDLEQIEGSLDKIIGQLQEWDGGKCVSLVGEHYGEKENELMKSAQPIANEVDAEASGEQGNSLSEWMRSTTRAALPKNKIPLPPVAPQVEA